MTEFESLLSKKTVEELMEYIDDFERYAPWALTAVVNELKARETVLHDEELNSLYERIEKKKEIEEEQTLFGSKESMKKYVVTDPNAPLLYSKSAVSLFSLFFTVIFGAILLALNIENKINKVKVIVVGVLFTTLAILIGNLVPHSSFYVYAINGIGGYVLSTEFWNKYLGRETKYRKKPIWIPLLISIIISVLLLVTMIYE
jgi:hypothetical protein